MPNYQFFHIFIWAVSQVKLAICMGSKMSKNILDKQRLILCRENLNITKQEAAKRMQMSQPAYLRYESGDRIPSIHVMQTMANVLGTSVEYLTCKTDSSLPISYLIEESHDPDLFYMIDFYKRLDSEERERFMKYVKSY